MTAEVAILNKYGVALAADSAVTIQQYSSGELKQKIYNTTNKLFTLSKYNPVGIMTYGSATVLEIPWEIIIKDYRKKLGRVCFDSIKEYCDHFIDFFKGYFPESEQENYFKNEIFIFLSILNKKIIQEVEKLTDEQDGIDKKGINLIATKIILDYEKSLKDTDDLTTIPEDFGKNVINKKIKFVNEIFDVVFEKLPLYKRNKKRLYKIRELLFVKVFHFSDPSGIVIAGFGDKEIFPSIINIKVFGVLENSVIYEVIDKDSISFENSAMIIPFAQREMVYSFMEGIKPEYEELLNTVLMHIFMDYPKILLESLSCFEEQEREKLLVSLRNIGQEQYKNLLESLKIFRRNRFVDPVISAV